MEVSLFKNACTFFEESVSKAVIAEGDPAQWKFAILNLVQSIELSLKERLRREHKAFIFKDIDAQKKTISLDEAVVRVQKVCGCQFSNEDIKAIKGAANKRHLIVHYEYTVEEREFKVIFAKLLGFLVHFFRAHLGDSIDRHVDASIWQSAISIVEYSGGLYKAASKLIDENEIEFILVCPSCGADTFVYQDNENTCYLCGHKEDVYECKECGKFVLQSDLEFSYVTNYFDDIYCYDCTLEQERAEYDYDRYVAMEFDLSRGK